MTARLPQPGGSVRAIRFDALDVVDVENCGPVARKDTFVDSVQMRATQEG